MKTRISDFLNVNTWLPEYSFQYEAGEFCSPRWVYARRDDGQPMRWHTQAQRDAARACFTNRRSVDRALQDLREKRLHLKQPGMAKPATPSTTNES